MIFIVGSIIVCLDSTDLSTFLHWSFNSLETLKEEAWLLINTDPIAVWSIGWQQSCYLILQGFSFIDHWSLVTTKIGYFVGHLSWWRDQRKFFNWGTWKVLCLKRIWPSWQKPAWKYHIAFSQVKNSYGTDFS